MKERRVNLSRHESSCSICAHPERHEIEKEFGENWCLIIDVPKLNVILTLASSANPPARKSLLRMVL